MPNEATEQRGARDVLPRSRVELIADAEIAPPCAEDAAEIHGLIAACPPLDQNSLYANLIQSTHFAQSCALARVGGRIVGWISGHRPPERSGTYFLWQVAVHPDVRGAGLARHMLADILRRPVQADVCRIETSITPGNSASWALFGGIAKWLRAPMDSAPWFDCQRHFSGRHDTEHLVTIGPFAFASEAI